MTSSRIRERRTKEKEKEILNRNGLLFSDYLGILAQNCNIGMDEQIEKAVVKLFFVDYI